ncbi:hypothetical protein CERZMDRAFT_41818 [Cercospora zeae-maydis SCOH1-5]|uniref:DUF7924 domain-containing protein n=1 Tax=Cercospora zeae-maydis SCOH1-5 TaxID=717836 RepID=A0A6A6FGE0_9PEZI|nr:hypothetical protein CERZMDRAFT_41818 [Cercospora zeae-maydis SCOH1-5]
MTRKRSRSRSAVRRSSVDTSALSQLDRLPKRRRLNAVNTKAGACIEQADAEQDAITFWILYSRWPRRYQDPKRDAGSSEELEQQDTAMLARKRSSTSLNAPSQQASGVSNDQKPREAKATAYQDPRYTTLLATKHSFMVESHGGPSDSSKAACQHLLTADQPTPTSSRFSDDVFKRTCQRLQSRNEAKVIQDISRLIVPSVEELIDFGADHLVPLVESVNEGWNNCITITKTRPQPDYAVGFGREAFSQEQLDRIQPFVGDLNDMSLFMATYYMYFPFLTCEVKCGAAALDIADRQNAHSMTVALRALVELFRLVGREYSLHREILAFSISHDHEAVKIFGHYAELDGPQPRYYRYVVRKFDFTDQNGRDKWTAYKFVRNVYDEWMPKHLQMIRSAIDDIPPDLCFTLAQSGASQDLGRCSMSQTGNEACSAHAEAARQSTSFAGSSNTPGTSVAEVEVVKKPRKGRRQASKS